MPTLTDPQRELARRLLASLETRAALLAPLPAGAGDVGTN